MEYRPSKRRSNRHDAENVFDWLLLLIADRLGALPDFVVRLFFRRTRKNDMEVSQYDPFRHYNHRFRRRR